MLNCNTANLSRIAYALLFLLSVITLILSCFIPIHIDDIMADIAFSRAGYDGWKGIGVLVICKSSFATPIPVTLLPGRAFAWLLYYPLSTPVAIRVFGVSLFAGWIGSLAWGIRKSLSIAPSWGKILSLIISLVFLGVMPFLPVFIRPETLMAIVIAFYALLPFYHQKNQPSSYECMIITVIFLFASSWFFSIHPKALLFTPLVLYSFLTLRNRAFFKAASLSVLLCTIIQSYNYWASRMQCPESIKTSQYINGKGLQLRFLIENPRHFFDAFFFLLGKSTHYLDNVIFASDYHLLWLPDAHINSLHIIANFLIKSVVVAVLGFWLFSLIKMARKACEKKTFLAPGVSVPFLIVISLILMAGVQGTKNFYDMTLFWLIGSCLTIILLYGADSIFSQRMRRNILAGLVCLSLLSQSLLISIYWILPAISAHAGINGEFNNDQEMSILHYSERHEHIVHAASQCGISPDQENQHLAVDMYTYLEFRDSYQPIFIKFIDNPENILLPFLKSVDSAGLITLCRSLPKNIQDTSIQDNGLCCIKKDVIYSSIH